MTHSHVVFPVKELFRVYLVARHCYLLLPLATLLACLLQVCYRYSKGQKVAGLSPETGELDDKIVVFHSVGNWG